MKRPDGHRREDPRSPASPSRWARSRLSHPAFSRTGSPLTPTVARKSEPASGSSLASSPSRDVVTKSSSSFVPPNVQAVTFVTGSSTTWSSTPSGVYRRTAPPLESAIQTPPSASTVSPSGRALPVSANGRRRVSPASRS
jgi:hypothetical protein